MTATDPRGDSGVQPEPHYCTTRPRADGTREGCPDWPGCLFSPPSAVALQSTPRRQAHFGELRERATLVNVTPNIEPSTLWADLAALAGFASGAVLVLAVGALLLPLFI